MIAVRRSEDRGRAELGWLTSRHSFSFSSYYDPRYMSFGPLRVMNEDWIAAETGFGTHPHRDMEILTYVVEGSLSHRDTLGNGSTIVPGELQLMSAGRGIAHSELNDGETPVHLLQIWIQPAREGTSPRYEQKDFGRAEGLCLVASPEGSEGSLTLGQDARVYRALLKEGSSVDVDLGSGRRAWVQVVRGELELEGQTLYEGDGASATECSRLSLRAQSDVEALVFDVA